MWRPICETGQGLATTPPEVHIQRWMILSNKEATLLNLHRAYFTRALQDVPEELVRHRYTPSVMAIYRSAWRLIEGLRLTWRNCPNPISRISLPWSQALSAAVVMCLLATRAPTSNMSPCAVAELDHLLELLREASPSSHAAANLLGPVSSLNRKAHEAMDRPHSGSTSCITNTELDRLGGKTHLLAEVGAPDSVTTGSSPSVTLTSIGSKNHFSTVGPTECLSAAEMHPTLAQDVRSFDEGPPTFTFSNLFDFPAPGPPVISQQPLHDIQQTVSDTTSFYPTDFQPYQPQPHHPAFEQAAPVLDATWQSFVEQLGF